MRNTKSGVEILVAPTNNERYLYYFAYSENGFDNINDAIALKSLVRTLFKEIENVES